jgi:mannose-1-phosphate guanylyltransferase
MKALLLAAGVGSRLRPITIDTPKCLVEIAGRPLLDYWLELLFGSEMFDGVVINTHYLPQVVKKFLTAHAERDRITVVHEPELLGTGGTLMNCRSFLGAGDFLVAHADNLTLFDPQDFWRYHRARPAGCLGTLMTFVAPDPRSCGVVELDGQGIVSGFYEKVPNPPSNLANAAVYWFSSYLFDIIEKMSISDISLDLIPHFLGRWATYPNNVYHRDIGTPASLAAAQVDFPPAYREFVGRSRS